MKAEYNQTGNAQEGLINLINEAYKEMDSQWRKLHLFVAES